MEHDDYVTNWHLYEECDALLKQAEELVKKLRRPVVIEQGKRVIYEIYGLRRMCDQHAG